jgi:indole-3-glycerol phosphate synthase
MRKPDRIPPDFLARMGASSAQRAAAGMQTCPPLILEARVRDLLPPPPLRLSPQGFDLIAEVKRRSPAAGALAGARLRITEQARSYVRGGAAALSVLTEPAAFDGDLSHLGQVACAVAAPCMRKDFLVAPYQVLEARAEGASGVLLIAAMLSDARLQEMLGYAHRLGLFALVEIFDAADLERSVSAIRAAGPAIVDGRCRSLLGVNCRNLRSLKVDFGRFAALAPRLPADIPRVAESGVESASQAARVAGLGYGLALVGTVLMRAPDPAAQVASLLAAGRASAAEAHQR